VGEAGTLRPIALGEVFAVLKRPNARSADFGSKLFDYAPNLPEGPVFRIAWANGDRSIVCVAMSEHERWSSLRDRR
jgi:hypothetical protein